MQRGPAGLPPKRVDRFYEDGRRFANLLAMTDRWLGELLDEIERRNGWDDALGILTTDPGLMFGEHGEWARRPSTPGMNWRIFP